MKYINLNVDNLQDLVVVVLTAEQLDALVDVANQHHNKLIDQSSNEATKDDADCLLKYAAVLGAAADEINKALMQEYGEEMTTEDKERHKELITRTIN